MPSIACAELRGYIECLHGELRSLAEHHVPDELRGLIRRYPLLTESVTIRIATTPMPIVAFVYGQSALGSARCVSSVNSIEAQIYGSHPGIDEAATVVSVSGSNCYVGGMTIEGRAIPVRLAAVGASCIVEDVEITRAPWAGRIRWVDLHASLDREYYSTERAARTASTEVLDGLIRVRSLESARVQLDYFLREYRKKSILVLGDYSSAASRLRLSRISEALRHRGYAPVLLSEIPDIPHFNNLQKLKHVAMQCRFVVVDDSSRSGQLAEIPEVGSLDVVMPILRMRGSSSSTVTVGMSITSASIHELVYDEHELDVRVVESCLWAEQVLSVRQDKLDSLYPWRGQDRSTDDER